MFRFFKHTHNHTVQKCDKFTEQLNNPLENQKIKSSLNENLATMKALFSNMDLMRYRLINTEDKKSKQYLIVFCDGVVDSNTINTNIIKPLMMFSPTQGNSIIDSLLSGIIQVGEVKKVDNFKNVVENVTYGDTILFAEGCNQAAVLNTKNFALRSITEPDNEKVLGGPREGFTESITQNISLILRRLRTNEFKTKIFTMGRVTQTSVCICYIDNIVNKGALRELFHRLDKIDIDGILDENYIGEIIKDNRYSAFRTTGYTERPDAVVGKLLEGRIAMLVDGSPMVFTIPYIFIENFQSSEDYFFNFYYTSFSRILRILAFFLTITVPGLYIAMEAFHQEMLPLQLLMRIALERQIAPMPAAVEAVIMLLVFDVLRETGVRMPSSVGHALSIVGALVIGQSAVEANLVAAPMIIVVAATGITGLLIPKLNAPITLWRMIILLMSAVFGFYGLTIGLSLLFIHINNLTSFGVEQITLLGNFKIQNIKDILIRMPWHKMIERPQSITRNLVRQSGGDEHN